MAQRISRTVQRKSGKAQAKARGKFDAPKHTKERIYVEARGENKEARLERRKELIAKYERLGYVLLQNEEEIKAVFSVVHPEWIDKFYDGSGLFFIWEFSGYSMLFEDIEERDKFIDKLSDMQAMSIMNFVNNNRIYEQNYLVAANGEVELTRKNQLCVRMENGDIKYIATNEKATNHIPERRSLTYEDIPVSVMKAILKELKLDKSKK